MPNFSTKQLKVDKPVLHIDDEFQTTKIKDNSIAISSISREVKSNNPEAIYSIQKTEDRRLIVSFDLKNASGTTSIKNEGRLNLDNANAVNSWVLDSQINRNVYRLSKSGPNYITIGSGEDTNIKKLRRFINRRFTIVMWIKFTNTGADEDIFSFKGSNTGTQHLSLTKTAGNMLKLSNYTDNLTTSLSRPTSWNHVAFSYNRKNNRRKLYVNGKKVAVSRLGSRLDLSGAVECFIGRVNGASTTYANADIYGFKIYKRNIRNNEVRRIYELSSLHFKIEIADLSSVLQLFYKMNDSGTTLKDTSRNTNDSSSITGTEIVTSPFGGVCRSFDGTDDVVILPNIRSVFHRTDFTIAFWVNIHTLPSGGDNTSFFFESKNGSPSASSTTNGHLLVGITTSNKLRFGFWNNSTDSATSISANTWYHVACVCVDGTSRTIYINGDNDITELQGGRLTMDSADGIITIGRRTGGSNSYQFTHFSMLNFRIFSDALNEIEIMALYNNDRHKKIKVDKIQGVGPAEKRVFISKSGNVDADGKFITKPLLTAAKNLVFHLQFNESDIYNGGVKAYDSSGRYTTGILNNFTTSNKHDPDFPNSLDFTGTNTYISFNDSEFLDFKSRIAKTEITITFWVNFNIESTGDKPLVYISDDALPGKFRAIIIHGTTTNHSDDGKYTKLNFEIKNSDSISTKELSSNNWYHCAFTYSPDGNNRRKIYINGVLEASQTHNNANVRLHSFTGGVFEIGRNPLDTPTYFGAGKLADFRIYNRELNGDEIGKIYFETSKNIDFSPYKLSLLNPSPIHSSSLMCQLRAENTGNSSATDRSGNNHHASASANLFDTTTLITTNKSFKFDSADKDFMVLDGYTTGNSFNGIGGSSPRSITFWTQITNLGTERPVIGYGDRSFYITIDEYEKVRIYSGSNKYIVFSPALTASQKQHIAVVIDPLNNVNTLIDSSKLFINGSKAYISGRSTGEAFTSWDGDNSKYIEVNDGNNMKTVFHQTDFSISMWVRIKELDGYERGIFESRHLSGSSTNAYLLILVNTSRLRLTFYGSPELYVKTTVDGSTNWVPTLNEWYHLVFTIVAGGTRKVYKDGDYNNSVDSTNLLTMNGTTGYVRFGLWSSYPAGIQNIDYADFRIYNKALTANEVKHIYELGKNNYRDDITGLVHQWPFDGDQGVRNIMSPTHYGVPYGLTITPQNFDINTEIDTSNDNNVEIGRRGVFYTEFDGTDDFIDFPVALKEVFHNTSFSISFWVYLNSIYSQSILTARNHHSSSNNEFLHLHMYTDRFRFAFYNNDLDTTNFTPETNRWYHFTCVYEYNKGRRIYIDGTLNKSDANTASLVMNSANNSGTFHVGKYATGTHYPHMKLTDLRIYSKVLSSSEITQLYKSGKYSFDNGLITNLVHHWKLNETFKYSIRHRSFDGTDDYISLPLSVKNIFHNTSFSISFWWRPQNVLAQWEGIFEARNTSSSTNNQWLFIQYYNNQIRFDFYNNELSTSNFSPIRSNVWYYITCVFETGVGKKIYINGVLNNSHGTTTTLTLNSTAGTGYVNLGKFSYGNRFGNMDLSDFRIYSKALSSSEVSTIYSAGKYYFSNTYDGTTISNLEYQYRLDSSSNVNDSGSNSAHGTNNGSTSTLDEDIHYTNEKSDVFHGITHTITENTYDYFDGYLDDIRIYNKAITEDQIKNIYNGNSGSYTNETSKNLKLKINPKDASISKTTLYDKSGNGLSNNMTLSNTNMLEGDNVIFNGVDSYASTQNISNTNKTTIVIKSKPEMTHESVIAGSKASGSSLANGDFQIKVKPCGYSNHSRNLIVQYTFFEGAGSIVYDAAAKTKAFHKENRLNITGATWNTTGGPFGEPCLSFDGSNDSVLDDTNGSSYTLWRDEVRLHDSPTAFSVSIWFYADGATDQDYIFDIGILVLNWKHSSHTTYSQSFFGRQDNSSTDFAVAKLYSGGTPNLSENTWYHATATWEWSSGTNGVLKAYLNGELVSTASSEAALLNNKKNLWVGVGNTSSTNYFNGRVSNLQFFNSTLTASEVKEIYDTAHLAYTNYSKNRMCMIPHFEDQLLAHWRCDEGSGSILHDSSKYKRHGTIRNAVWSTHSQFPDLNVLSFDGTDDYVEDIPNFQNELNKEFSITCWARPTADLFGTVAGALFSTRTGDSNGFTLYAPYSHALFSNTGTIALRIHQDIAYSGSDLLIVSQINSNKSGEWFHVAVTFSSTHIALYVNGVVNNDMGTGFSEVSEISSSNWNLKGLNAGAGGQLTNNMSLGFRIGRERSGSSNINHYLGLLSDLRIYKGTLTGEEVRQIYRSDYYKYSVDIKINSKIYNLECDKMLSINKYHNLALVYVSGKEARLFLDNSKIGKITLPYSQQLNTNNSITLGAQDLNGSRSLWFEGCISEFRIYNKSLSNKEIEELGCENERCLVRIQGYDSKISGLSNASLINLGSDSTVKIQMNGFDTTPEAINGSMPDGVIGKNIAFNGTDEYLSINTNSRVSKETQKNFTITGWVKPSSADSGTNNPIIAKYGSADNSKYYKINFDHTNSELEFTVTSSVKAAYFDGSNDNITVPKWANIQEPWSITFWVNYTGGSSRIIFSTWDGSRVDNSNNGWNFYIQQGNVHRFGVESREHIGSGDDRLVLSSNYNTINSGGGRHKWFHIAFTSVNGRQNMYVDGKLTNSAPYQPFRNWTHTAAQSDTFYIGETYNSGSDFIGYLSDLRIYSQELNIEDISRIFKAGLGGYGGNVIPGLELRYKFNNESNPGEDTSGNNRHGTVNGNTRIISDTNTTEDHTITTNITTDVWTHFALVVDSDTHIMTVYINGIKSGQQEIENINNDFPEEITIGGDGTNFFMGSVCDIRIYDTALKSEVIQTLLYEGYGNEFKKLDNIANSQSNEPSLPNGLKIHYNGSTNDNELLDISGSKNNALLIGSPTITSSGKYNSGIVFDNTEIGGNWTFNTITDIWTTSIAHGLNVNDAIVFTLDGGGATGYTALNTYYVISAPSANTVQLSTIRNGTYTNGTQDSSGNWTAIKPQLGQLRSGSVREYLKDNFSISTWIKFANDGNNPPALLQEDAAIFGVYSKFTATGANTNLMLYKKYVDGQHEIHFTFYGSDFSTRIDPSTDWIHIAATYGITQFNENLICHIPLDENFSVAYPDKETKRLHYYTGGPAFITDDPNFSSCYSFDGTDDSITIHESAMRQVNKAIGGGNSSNPCELTIMLWMQTPVNPGYGSKKVIRMSGGDINFNWQSGSGNFERAFELNTSANSKRRIKYSSILSSSNWNQWNHYCITIRRPGNDLKVKIYLNGVLDTNPVHNGASLTNGEVSFDGEHMSNVGSSGTILRSSSTYLQAKLKDFRMYNKALTDDEVSNIMLSKSIYVNGELLVSSTLDNSNNQMSYLNVSSADIATLGEVAFSKRLYDSEPQITRLNGTIDDFRIYNRKITSEEVSLLYNNAKINMPLIQNTNGLDSELYTSNYYLSNTNRPSNPIPKIGRDNLQIHYTFEKRSGTTILDSNFSDKPTELYLNRNLMAISSKDSENIVLEKTYNATKSTVGGNWTFVASSNIWTTEILIGDNWTFTSSSNTWTTSRAHGLSVDDTIQFTHSGGGASGYSISTTYHVISVSSLVTLKLSATNGGSELNGTTDSSGNWYAKKTPLLPHNFKKGDKIEFITNGGGASGYSTGIEYYVINVPTITTLQLSDEYNGSVLNGSSNSSGNWAAITPTADFPYFYRKCGIFNGSSDYLETTFPSIGTNWTFNSTTDIWTTSTDHGLKLGDKITFTTSGGGATGYNTETIYYVISVPSTNTVKLATTLLAAGPQDGSANSSGNWAARLQPIVLGDSLWTISCWINTKEVNKNQTIWSFSDNYWTNFPNAYEYRLYITPDGNKLSFIFNNNLSSTELNTERTILKDTWYNVVVVRKISGLSTGVFVYINGEIVGRSKMTFANTKRDPTLKIGCNFSKSANYFAGKIGDFRIYDTQLNDYQITKLYRCEENNGPLIHYTFDSSSNEIIKDLGSERANLKIVGAVLDNTKQKVGISSICFNNNNSYCKSSYPGLVGFTNNTGHPMTISLWFKKFSSTASGTLMHYGAQNKEVKIFISDTSPYNVEVKVGSVIIESLFSTLDGINTDDIDSSGDWKHIALVILPGKNYNNTVKNVRIFVNGINQTKYTTNNTLYETTVNTSDIDEIFLLGRSQSGQYFNGWIDDFRIYDVALSPSEIFELNYNIYNYKEI